MRVDPTGIHLGASVVVVTGHFTRESSRLADAALFTARPEKTGFIGLLLLAIVDGLF